MYDFYFFYVVTHNLHLQNILPQKSDSQKIYFLFLIFILSILIFDRVVNCLKEYFV